MNTFLKTTSMAAALLLSKFALASVAMVTINNPSQTTPITVWPTLENQAKLTTSPVMPNTARGKLVSFAVPSDQAASYYITFGKSKEDISVWNSIRVDQKITTSGCQVTVTGGSIYDSQQAGGHEFTLDPSSYAACGASTREMDLVLKPVAGH